MIKTLIIDDEKIIREGLKTIIPWKELGYSIVGEAKDGEEAVKLIQKTMPDLIITDIRMPFIDGLELIEFIKPTLPDAYIIILSGYDDFHYAQKALQLGVYDFLLKPVKIDYLEKILKKIKCELIVKKNKIKELPEEDAYFLKKKWLKKLIDNDLEDNTIEEVLNKYELKDMKNKYFSVLIVAIDNFPISIANMSYEEINGLQKQFYQSIKKILVHSDKEYIFENNLGNALILILGETRDEIQMKQNKIRHLVRSQLNQDTDFSITIAISEIHKAIQSLYKCVKEAHEANNQRFIEGYNKDYFYNLINLSDMKKQQNRMLPNVDFSQNKLKQLINRNNVEDIEEYINDIFHQLSMERNNSSLYITLLVTSVYVEVLNILNAKNKTINEIYDDPLSLYKQLTVTTNVYDIKPILKNLIMKTADYISINQSKETSMRILEAKEYIGNNYHLPELTLQDVATYINMGACYLSSLFKKETGESFIDYLTRLRIQKAKELLRESSKKSYQISFEVGYNTPTYFSTLFKKMTGKSPTEYKKEMEMNDKNGDYGK